VDVRAIAPHLHAGRVSRAHTEADGLGSPSGAMSKMARESPHVRVRHTQAGVTLMELLIAITLLSLLSVGMLMAMRIGLTTYTKADDKLMENRRIAGAQRIIEEQIEGFMPVMAVCGAAGGPGVQIPFFEGGEEAMRLVSAFSLQQGWRGRPQVLEMFVIPRENGGVRLVVNEIPYTGPVGAGQSCTGVAPDPATGLATPRFTPVTAGPGSFVLADKLAYCRFSYLRPSAINRPQKWLTTWSSAGWPAGVRLEMAPLKTDSSQIQPITVTAPLYVRRSPDARYHDF
jgi:prepilin-type N-terminal cleavage/methylation domain-containing protein